MVAFFFFFSFFIMFSFSSLSAQETNLKKLPYGIKPDVEIGFHFRDEVLFAFIVAAILLLSFLLYRYIRKRKRKSIQIHQKETPIQETLRKELNSLKKKDIEKEEERKTVYFRLSEIARTILALEGIGTTQQTFDEFKPIMHTSNLYHQEIKQKILLFLEKSEYIKFAKQTTTQEAFHEDLNLCFQLLELYEEKKRKEQTTSPQQETRNKV